jgi:multicomponent Na+:H+ antiporter subunit B
VRWLGLALVLVAAATVMLGVADLPPHGSPDAPVHTHVGARYLERGVAETGMRNLVTAVLLVYRGFDTLLEVVVIFSALVAVLALPRGQAARPGDRDDRPSVASLTRKGPGATAHAIPVSPVVTFVVHLLGPFIAVFALASLYRGHVSPGGGFQSAAIFGALFIALALVEGRARVARLVPLGARVWLQALGPLMFAFVGLVGWVLTGAFLGYPADAASYVLREAMVVTVELGIAVGGAVILAQLFMAMEG